MGSNIYSQGIWKTRERCYGKERAVLVHTTVDGKRSGTGEVAPNVGFIPVSRPFWSIPSGAGFFASTVCLEGKTTRNYHL